MKFLSNVYTNPMILTTLILTQTNPHDGESFCVPVFCDFIRNYSGTYVGPLVTLF